MKSMCAKYILGSVLYWAEEYHIGGFRFDPVGLLDTRLMETIGKELDARWGCGGDLHGTGIPAGGSPGKNKIYI